MRLKENLWREEICLRTDTQCAVYDGASKRLRVNLSNPVSHLVSIYPHLFNTAPVNETMMGNLSIGLITQSR